MANDLSTPLTGRRQRLKNALGRPHLPIARILFGLIGVIAIGTVARLVLVDDPTGGRPSQEAGIVNSQVGNSVADTVASGPATITADPQQYPADGSITVVPAPAADTATAEAHSAPNAFGIVPELSEETANGPIPRISGTGQTPFATYHHPFEAASAGTGPRIALIVTGLGINEQGSLDAIAQLPDLVTLAFAPYGKALEKTVAVARGGGHEVMLEVPLEPFDFPQNDPGPHTLLTGQPPRENLEKLFWLMARFGGYFGIINNMGARFTASAGDFGPVMEELGARGVGYIDDGSSNRSVSAQLASANKVPYARASMLIDANPARSSILSALDSLEAEAMEHGSAIGIVSALPISIQAVSEWSAGLDGKGIALVPASALMQ
ncbi:divergent polysaccharide deacetylase family protein [Devosia sp.]|uniref:divergent polysaccharide deacetylase family protein n=1 Tax=Devosia sp. TaxID=1871048 RepID=UPI001B2DC6A3|nr:divergent polysaccharide deacetylase family protein [Devosia sp.]MBO9588775.1 divergent polysaccharide deacetylase family protein [Devosia sp.]